MSLDVYLKAPEGTKIEPIAGGQIFIRRNGATVEISRGEWDELYPGREPVVALKTPEDDAPSYIYSGNITHNLTQMAKAAGCYEPLWRPGEHGMEYARDLIQPLRDGLATLQADPDHFKTFNPENGWGDYDGLVNFIVGYLAACEQWPEAEVSTWV